MTQSVDLIALMDRLLTLENRVRDLEKQLDEIASLRANNRGGSGGDSSLWFEG